MDIKTRKLNKIVPLLSLCLLLICGWQRTFAEEKVIGPNREQLEQYLECETIKQDRAFTKPENFTLDFNSLDIGQKHEEVRKYIQLINLDLGVQFGQKENENKQHLYFIDEKDDPVVGRIEFDSEDIYINDYWIDSTTIEDYLETLSHEIFHFYEYNKYGKEKYFSTYTDYKQSMDLYDSCEAERKANRYSEEFVRKVKEYSLTGINPIGVERMIEKYKIMFRSGRAG